MNEDSSEIKEDKNASKEQTAALNSAKNYADGMHMSKDEFMNS
nr:Ltp family lipoprotein [Staphylococcus hominis]